MARSTLKAFHPSRVMRRYAIVLKVITDNAAIRAWGNGWQHQQALHLSRAMRRQAVVPDVFTYIAALSAGVRGPAAPTGPTSVWTLQRYAVVLSLFTHWSQQSAREGDSSTSGHCTSCERCSAMPSRQV